MIRKVLTAAGLATLAVMLLESQGTGYAASEVRTLVAGSSGPEPQEVVAAGTDADGVTTLLAAGDIADCRKRPGIRTLLPNTARLLGIATELDPDTSEANLTADLARRLPAMPILALGDIAYDSGSPVEFAECFDPVWGALKPRILPTPGNHDYKSIGAFGYYDYFGAQAGPDRTGWYATNVPGWLILSLNSEVDAAPNSAQATWLRAKLRDAKDACILAFYHRPAYSLRKRDGRENAVALFRQLRQGGATLVLNGHNHFYERTAPLDDMGRAAPDTGTVGFTVGTGGRRSGGQARLKTTEAAVFGHVGLLKLELRRGGYSWAYLDAPAGRILDEGRRACIPPRA